MREQKEYYLEDFFFSFLEMSYYFETVHLYGRDIWSDDTSHLLGTYYVLKTYHILSHSIVISKGL